MMEGETIHTTEKSSAGSQYMGRSGKVRKKTKIS